MLAQAGSPGWQDAQGSPSLDQAKHDWCWEESGVQWGRGRVSISSPGIDEKLTCQSFSLIKTG